MLTRMKKNYSGALFGKEGDYGKLNEEFSDGVDNESKNNNTTVASPIKTKNGVGKLFSLPKRISLESKQAPSFGSGYKDLLQNSPNSSTWREEIQIFHNDQDFLDSEGATYRKDDKERGINEMPSPRQERNVQKQLRLRKTLSDGDTPYFIDHLENYDEEIFAASKDVSSHVKHRHLRVTSVTDDADESGSDESVYLNRGVTYTNQPNYYHPVQPQKRNNNVNKLLSLPRRISTDSKYPTSFNIGYEDLERQNPKTLCESNNVDCFEDFTFPSVFHQKDRQIETSTGQSKQQKTQGEINSDIRETAWLENDAIQAQYVGKSTTQSKASKSNLNKLLSLPRRISSESKHPPCYSIDYEELRVPDNNRVPISTGTVIPDWDEREHSDKLRCVMEPA